MEREGIYKEPEYGFDDKTLNELFSEQPPLQVAGKGQRVVNYIVDHFIMGFIFFFLFAMMGGLIQHFEGLNGGNFLTTGQNMIIFIFFLFCLSTYINYHIFFEYFLGGKTVGKMITGTKVIMKDGSEPSFKNILLRTLVRRFPFEAFSFLGSNSSGWHDKFSNTIVVIDNSSRS